MRPSPLANARCRRVRSPSSRRATGWLVVDALFGAGLARPLDGVYAEAIARLDAAGARVVAVDLPSGVSGAERRGAWHAPRAETTVTFFRKKPGHLLYPGRPIAARPSSPTSAFATMCSRRSAAPASRTIRRTGWRVFPSPATDTHKYARGHVGVFSGGPAATGAARLSAMAAARAGAGAVTLLSPANALAVNAAHLTSIILKKAGSMDDVAEFMAARKPGALVFGPGLGTHAKVGAFALDLIAAAAGSVGAIVFDADGLTVLAERRDEFFERARAAGAPALVLTPHEGEFRRLFPDLASRAELSKLDKARQAAAMANAVVIYKGPDTVIAAPDGRAAINANGTPLLATAGSGDVLAGICAGLMAQRMPPFEAACAAVWMHAEAASRFGPGLIAEDLPLALAPVLRELAGRDEGGSAMNRLAAALLALACLAWAFAAHAAEQPVLFVEQPIVLYELEDARL